MIYDRPTMICENLSPDDNILFTMILHLETDITDYPTHFLLSTRQYFWPYVIWYHYFRVGCD